MKPFARLVVFALLLASLLGACAPSGAAMQSPAQPEVQSLPAEAPAAPTAAAPEQKAAAPGASDSSGMPSQNAAVQTGPEALADTGRMVIKNAELRLLVQETDNAIDRSLQVVGDLGGYVISSRVWYQQAGEISYKYATLTIGVPAAQFETAMRRFRALSLKVLDETASGQDVTDEYVDLQSQLTNLEATRERIRAFLVDAKTVEESLRINQELTNIEAQIEQVKGRINYLSNRSAYSTITLTLEPEIPPATATPTPTPVPTQGWNPGDTVKDAQNSVVFIYQRLIELFIWIIIVILPLLLPPAFLFWLLVKFFSRKK